MMTTQDLVKYYAGLLILQYLGKAKAAATIEMSATPAILPQTTVQEISFSAVSTSGTFLLDWEGVDTAAINWNDSPSTIQGKLQAISGLGSVTVSGSIASQLLIVTFTGVAPVATLLIAESNSLVASGVPVTITIAETDVTLPIAVQDAYNLFGPNIAKGVQLDVLGKYAGVSRTGNTFVGPVTLGDSDFTSLIQLAILKNSSGSSLATIQALLHMFFPDEILVFDYANMQMSYLVSSTLGSQDFIEIAITEGLLPKPMAVGLASVIFAPIITTFFGFRTYELPAFNSSPFNDYASYQTDWPWLTYADAIIV